MIEPEGTAEALLAERIGLDPQAIGAGAIARALHARMSALGLRDRDDYLRRLARSDVEQQELIEEIVIPESWFFRDERPFAALRVYLAARGVGDRDGSAPPPPLRLLSVPCACGEEPYSIAITLLDLGLAPRRFQIDAVDISARHLAVAERGIYRINAFRGTDLAFRDRHFHPDTRAQSFTLDPTVRALVRFTRGNLLDLDLLRGQPPYDIIFCRNVLIYLDAAARRRVFATLDRLLGPAGLLFVGHAERLAIADPRFVPWGENASFALHRAPGRTPGAVHPEPPHSGRSVRRAEVSSSRPLSGDGRSRSPTPATPGPRRDGRTLTAPATGGAPPIPEPPPLLPESSATLLDEANALADQGRNDEAAARCEAALGRFGPTARAFFLLGLVRQSGGRALEAEDCFRKAIYLDPDHHEALTALALSAQRRGDTGAAAGYRRRAERARVKKGTS